MFVCGFCLFVMWGVSIFGGFTCFLRGVVVLGGCGKTEEPESRDAYSRRLISLNLC